MDENDPRLMSGETVVFKTEKHWLAPIADSGMAVLLIIGALVLAWLQTPQTDGIMGFINRVLNLIEIVLFLGGVGWIIYNVVAWRSAKYAVTNHRVLFEEGLLRKKSADTLLTSITDVRMRQSAIGRSTGYGDLQILSASGEAGADLFTTVKGADKLKKVILEQKLLAQGVGSGGQAAAAASTAQAPATAAAPSAQNEAMATLASLAKLRDQGAITPDEYETKKTELLSRL